MAQTASPTAPAPDRSAAVAPPVVGPRDLDPRRYRLAVGGSVAAVAALLGARLTAWPPHEDETLALFVGRGSLGGLLDTVLGERGGAPLHFLLAWIVEHAGGGHTGLRVVSAVFALASIPLVAAIGSRLDGRTTGALAAALAASSWVLLFHGVYGRMYSLFLFTSALSYLALLWALRRGSPQRWTVWGAAILLTVATHPYGALVLASQGVFVLLVRERLREAIAAFAGVAVLGLPFWITDLVLAGRFEVGVGGGGGRLGSPARVLQYLHDVAADYSAGPVVVPVVLALAGGGLWALFRDRRRAALLVTAVVATPALAFLVARLGANAAPETRHLIFALPFFAVLVAAALVRIARSGRAGAPRVAGLVAALLVAAGVGWTWEKTPAFFSGEPAEREAGRQAAAAWLVATGRPDDILLGYEPVYLAAWRRSDEFTRLVLPRADARLALDALREARKPLGRGVWVLNAHDVTNPEQKLTIPLRLPRPADVFEARVFGPYLVLRSREPTRTVDTYLRHAAAAMLVGKTLEIGDADVNFSTVSRAAALGR